MLRTAIWAVLLVSGCSDIGIELQDIPFNYVAPSPDHGSWLSMDLAPDGERLAVAYYDRTEEALGFAVGEIRDDQIFWKHEQVDGYPSGDSLPTSVGMYTSMKVAPDGTVWVAYYDQGADYLKVAHRVGPVWTADRIDSGGGMWNSLAFGADGKPVIAHYSKDDRSLRVSRFRDAESGWSTATVLEGAPFAGVGEDGVGFTREAQAGEYIDFQIVGGREYIAYYDRAQQRLGLLEGSDGNFNQTFITSPGVDAGQWPSLLVDGDNLFIGFHDVENQDLVIGSRTGGAWTFAVADDGAYRGADVELFKKDGELAAVYFDGQNNDMLYVERSGQAWLDTNLGADEQAVGFHNEVVRVNGQYWAASYDFTNRSIYAREIE